MARIQIPVELLTSRLGLTERFSAFRQGGSLTSRFANMRPVSEFFDMRRVSKPAHFGEVQSRVNYNLGHFSTNYLACFIMLSLYALLTNWLLMFDIFLVVGGLWGIGKLEGRDFELGTIRATTSQLYTTLLCVSVPLGLIASPFSTLMWLIGASGVVILGHASFMEKPIDEAFSGEARRRERGGPTSAAEKQIAGDASQEEEDESRVRELNSEDELKGNTGTLSRRSTGGYNNDNDDSYDDDDDDYSEDSGVDDLDPNLSPEERDEILAQAAMRRIQRAQESGSTDVHLSNSELAALQRYQQRMEEEARAHRKARRKEREANRVAIPISQLTTSLSRHSTGFGGSDASSPEESDRGNTSSYPSNSASIRKRGAHTSSVEARDRSSADYGKSTASSRTKTAVAAPVTGTRPTTPAAIAANATPPASTRNSPNSAEAEEKPRRKTRASMGAASSHDSTRRHR